MSGYPVCERCKERHSPKLACRWDAPALLKKQSVRAQSEKKAKRARTDALNADSVRAQEIERLQARIAELETQIVKVATGPCPECEARKRKNRERMAKRRAES